MALTGVERVRRNTAPEINARIDREAQVALRAYAAAGEPAVADRIDELDREWDFERVLEAEAATMGLLGVALGAGFSSRLLIVPGFAIGMVLLHALQGWYPLLPLFRRLGVRTQDEIDREKYALKAVRGDFDRVLAGSSPDDRAQAAWTAVTL